MIQAVSLHPLISESRCDSCHCGHEWPVSTDPTVGNGPRAAFQNTERKAGKQSLNDVVQGRAETMLVKARSRCFAPALLAGSIP